MKLKIKIIILSIIVLSISCSCNCFAGSNVEHIFDLAKKSVCKDVAIDILNNPLFTPDGRPTGKTGYFISKLRQLTATPFPYRFEITNGYQEGFVYYALLGYLSEMDGKIPFAYRCYQNSLAYIDEDKSFDRPLPRAEIYLAIGRTCLAAGRYMDAEEYMSFVCSITSTNKPIHWQAVAALADISRRYGRFDRALAFYTTLYNNKPIQPSDIWYVYIQTLFDMGYYEFGVRTILYGLRQNDISSVLVENDYFLKVARRYWLHFSNDDIIEFYKLLGLELKCQKVKGNEKLIALLINTRRLIQKVYPLLFTQSQDDLAQLKARLEHSKSEINNQIVTITKHSQKVLGAFSKKKHNTQIQTIYTNNCIEDAINSILIKQHRLNGEYQSVSVTLWTNLLSKFTINDFRQIEIDYSSALFIIYAGIGKAYYCKAFPQYSESYIRRQMEFTGYSAFEDESIRNYFDEEMVKQADEWLAKAVNEIDDEINPDRLADVLRLRGLIYLIPDFGNTNKALEYLNHALDLASDNVPLMLNILGTLSSINNLDVKDNFYQDEINRVYEKYGDCIPRDIFYDLAKKQFEKGDNYAGLNIVLDGLKRTPLKVLNDKLLRLVFQNRSFCKYNQLKLLKRALLTSLMRIPATPTKNNEFLQIIDSSRRPWLSNQIILANIEESQKYSKKNFDIITSIMKTNFSIRAGLLFTKAQEIRQENNKEIELTGWLNCSEYIISALRKKQGLVANKNYLKTGKHLIGLFENYQKQISTNQLSRVLKDKKKLEKLLNGEKL